ncbi:MAG: glycosyltransferase [Pseudoclavibacter sp.]
MSDLYVFPAWETNPYLAMLALEPRAQGWGVRGSIHFDRMLGDVDGLGAGDVFHLHWTAPVADVARASEFERRIERLVASLDAAKGRGVRVLWTVHNLITHDARFPEQEIALAQALAGLADTVIVLNPATAEAVAPWYELPAERTVHLPHASYRGVYPRSPGRGRARRDLGIPAEQFVLGMTGALRPYKGVPVLLEAARMLGEDDPTSTVSTAALLAGGASRTEIEAIEATLPRRIPVHRRYGTLPDADLVRWTAASDVFVLPVTGILNSGSMLFAATLGVPVVLPDLPHLVAEFGGEAWVEFFEASAPDRAAAASGVTTASGTTTAPIATAACVADAVRRVRDAPREPREEAALAFARARLPRSMSVDYLRLLRR